jgi:hypothetical protein
MPGEIQRLGNVSRAGAEEHALNAPGHDKFSAHATTPLIEKLLGWFLLAGIFCIFQCRDRAIFCLNGIASRLGIGMFRKLALCTVQKRFCSAKFVWRKLCSARLPGNGNRLPGVTHFLYRWPGFTTTQDNQQCK